MKKKIRFLINTLAGGGAEKVLVDLLNLLDADRYEVSLVTMTGGVHAARLAAHIHYKCIVRTALPWLNRLLGKIVMKLPPAVFAGLFLRGEQDIEVAYLEGKPTRCMAAKKCKAAKKLAFVHCDLSAKNMIAPLYKDSAECLAEYSGFSKVCFVSQRAKQGFEAAIGQLENGCVIHNINDYDRIRKLACGDNGQKYHTDGLKLIAVGRLIEEKAYDRLLRVVMELERNHSLELWIVGEGEQRDNLEKLIEKNNIRSVKLMGYQENPYSYMKKADLFVCSSISEGYSTVVTEALALGLPVLTTNCAGMDEILEQGKHGMIVENNEEALKAGLSGLFGDPEQMEKLRAAALAKSRVMTNEQAMREYTELFS